MSVSLTLKNISRSYIKDNEKFFAVQNVNLEVKPGEFLTFLGPSGCGKTTTLRMIAGLKLLRRAKSFWETKTSQKSLPMNVAWASYSRTTLCSRT